VALELANLPAGQQVHQEEPKSPADDDAIAGRGREVTDAIVPRPLAEDMASSILLFNGALEQFECLQGEADGEDEGNMTGDHPTLHFFRRRIW
jgi:hypothetical protein